MNRVFFAAKASFAALSLLSAAALIAAPAQAGSASASGAATLTTPSGRTTSVSAEVVSSISDFTAVTVAPTWVLDGTNPDVVNSITSLSVTPVTAAVSASSGAAGVMNAVYGTGTVAPAGNDNRLAILRALVSGGALD